MNSATGGRLQDAGLLILRVLPGILLIVFHGWGKLVSAVHLFQGQEWGFIKSVETLGFPIPAFFAVCAALAESVVSGFVVVGLFTRYAAAVLIFNFSVAVYRHTTVDWKIELAAMYWIVFLVISLLGPGRYSLDARLQRKR